MMVVLALILALFGGPNASYFDGTSGGPSISAQTSAQSDDGTSGGPSLTAPISGPSDDGGSGGPSHP